MAMSGWWVMSWLLFSAASTPARWTTVEQVRAELTHLERPTLVHFWALWCHACLDELPRQVEQARRLAGTEVAVLFVNLDGFEQEAAVRRVLEGMKATEVARHTQLDPELDGAAVAALFDKSWDGTLPATFGVLPGGRVERSIVGPTEATQLQSLAAALQKARRSTTPKTSPRAGP